MKYLFFVSLPLLVLLLTSSNEKNLKGSERKIMILISAQSETIAAGTKYEGNVFVYEVPEALPEMFLEGRQMVVDENGVGRISFTATGGAYDKDGNAKKKYKGAVKISRNGKDTTIIFSKDYLVQKPVIEVSGVTVRTLYKNCGNEIDVDVPALKETYNPSFTTTGAMIIKGAKKERVILIPTAQKVTLNVASNGNMIGSETFIVSLIPDPIITIQNDSSYVKIRDGVSISELGKVRLVCNGDESFKAFYPKDARYRVGEWEATLMRANDIIETKIIDKSEADLSGWQSKAKKGDRIVVDAKKVLRTNFLNQIEEVNMKNSRVFIISLY